MLARLETMFYFCLSVCLYVYLCVCLSFCPSICLSVCMCSYDEDVVIMLARLETMFYFDGDQWADKLSHLAFMLLHKLAILAQHVSFSLCISQCVCSCIYLFCLCPCVWISLVSVILSLPYPWSGCKHIPSFLRPQHGEALEHAMRNAPPQQTSRSVEHLRSFSKLQEQKQMDISQRIQSENIVT